MSRMPKIKQIVEDIFRRKTREVEIKDEFIAIGALNLGVILGDVNYLNGLKTNVGRKGTKLFEAFFHTIKEYYANFHIEVAKKVSDKLSTQAIFDLGDFATDFAPRKVGERWSELSDTLSRVRSFEQCHNHESFSEKWVEELCDSVAIFIKKFPLINKKKVNNSINKYLLTINNDKVPREVLFKKYGIERIKFKRIIKRNLLKRYIFKSGKSRRKQKFEKFVLFKAFPIKIY
uniref:Uncharacterized protein n=1 Tax=Meloidogyne hapla TaxID=6305 RepID=A0A1I8BNL5_MELHA